MARIALITLLLLSGSFLCNAQEVTPDGYFLDDSTKIGQEIRYSLYIQYPKEMEVLFPDSSYNFAPFEYYSREYYPTKVDNGTATDSVVYSLVSFEIEPLQYLQLPIYILDGKDSTEVYPPLDSIYLQEMVIQMPDSLDLISNASFKDVTSTFNYPYYSIGAAVFIVLLILAYFIFGNAIIRKIKLYRLRKEYDRFSAKFENGINKLKKHSDNTFIEEVLIIWKSYMERLEDKPFTKYTTKEILKSGYDDQLKNVLVSIDRSIYGRYEPEGIHRNFETLEDFALERYRLKLKEISNG